MTEIAGYRGSRFDAGSDQPLLRDTWQALDELDPTQVDTWLEVLSGKKYRRQLSELGERALLNDETDYVLQIVFKLQNTATPTGNEYLEQSHALLRALPGSTVNKLREGRVTPPKYEGPFGAADEEDNAWYIHEPFRYTIERKTGGRTLVLAGVASPLRSGFRVYNSEDWIRTSTVRSARDGNVIFNVQDGIKNGIPLGAE